MNDRDLVFTTSIPVFSSLLRPSKLDGALHYEKTNENYNLLNNLVKRCNRDTLRINQKIKEKLNLKGKEVFVYMPTFKGLVNDRKDEQQKNV